MSRLDELNAKIDDFFARVEAHHGEDMQCHTGCSDCCRVRLTITRAEAAAVRAAVTNWPVVQRRALAPTAADPADACAALDANGRCRIYDARPVVCRSHGVPIRMRSGALPVVESCFRNFTHTAPAADCILDQTTLSALTLAVDRAAGGDGTRVDLAALLAELAVT